jgi:hypothetical protein
MVQSSRGRYLEQVIIVIKCQATVAVIPVLLTGTQFAWTPCHRLVVLGRCLHICGTNRAICAVLARHHGAFGLLETRVVSTLAACCIPSSAQMDLTC